MAGLHTAQTPLLILIVDRSPCIEDHRPKMDHPMDESQTFELGNQVRSPPIGTLQTSLTTQQPLDYLTLADLSRCYMAVARRLAASRVSLVVEKRALKERLRKPKPSD